jgi:hypothetical protein
LRTFKLREFAKRQSIEDSVLDSKLTPDAAEKPLRTFKEAAKRGRISSQVFLHFDLRQVHDSVIAIENACAPSFRHGSRHSPNAVRRI